MHSPPTRLKSKEKLLSASPQYSPRSKREREIEALRRSYKGTSPSGGSFEFLHRDGLSYKSETGGPLSPSHTLSSELATSPHVRRTTETQRARLRLETLSQQSNTPGTPMKCDRSSLLDSKVSLREDISSVLHATSTSPFQSLATTPMSTMGTTGTMASTFGDSGTVSSFPKRRDPKDTSGSIPALERLLDIDAPLEFGTTVAKIFANPLKEKEIAEGQAQKREERFEKRREMERRRQAEQLSKEKDIMAQELSKVKEKPDETWWETK
eukprot:TRINITY_DN80461_c0_g1_i1.p1 TRINITY_DN80461_c0_g1~~TRINITY_DN80461_c0_g1_i1.p1  ORF type:complete len:268 (-),score=72.74 TRINITY_DN80461_c0_g1_i1:327-1130(-)